MSDVTYELSMKNKFLLFFLAKACKLTKKIYNYCLQKLSYMTLKKYNKKILKILNHLFQKIKFQI